MITTDLTSTIAALTRQRDEHVEVATRLNDAIIVLKRTGVQAAHPAPKKKTGKSHKPKVNLREQVVDVLRNALHPLTLSEISEGVKQRGVHYGARTNQRVGLSLHFLHSRNRVERAADDRWALTPRDQQEEKALATSETS